MRLKIVVISIALIGAVIAFAGYMYNKPHKDIRAARPDYNTTVEKLMQEFGENQQLAFDKYSGKVLLVRGKVESFSSVEMDLTNILLQEGEYRANCEMDTLFKMNGIEVSAGDSVNVKGLFVGLDDLLGELQLKKCSIEN